ncbi:MAG: TolB protein [Pseudoalteromonas tetraodonis]|jgi:TolB protein
MNKPNISAFTATKPLGWCLSVAVAAILLINAGNANAVLRIEITEGIVGGAPVAMVPFQWDGEGDGPDEDIAEIVSNDLGLTGRFTPLSRKDMLENPAAREETNFLNWRVLGIDHVLIGRIKPAGNGKYMLEYQLLDVFAERTLFSYAMPVAKDRLRAAAHYISDQMYSTLTGEQGAFSTQIAYVAAQQIRGRLYYRLTVADSDGANAQVVWEDVQPIMSPTWSPTGNKLAYVSFQGGRAAIYVHDLRSGERKRISSREGINGAPSWSPNGDWIAMALSEGSNLDIFLHQVETGRVKRLTTNPSIDTEPTWSPDSKTIAFTSNRGGAPQVYLMTLRDRSIKRITFEGDENARPRFSPDGSKLAVITRDRGQYRVGIVDMETRSLLVLTKGSLDESPSFSPNGAIIIYSNNDGNKAELAAVSVDGRVKQRLSGEAGEVREPVWGPYIQ